MEIALVGPTSLRIKGKLAALAVDPVAKTKILAEAVLLLSGKDAQVEGSRLSISGAGEYEVGGVKITALKHESSIAYYVSLDGMTVLVAKASGLKGKENLRDVEIAVVLADGLVDPSILATVADGLAIFYGPFAKENMHAMGKNVEPVGKYATTKEKLPVEMEVVLLSQ